MKNGLIPCEKCMQYLTEFSETDGGFNIGYCTTKKIGYFLHTEFNKNISLKLSHDLNEEQYKEFDHNCIIEIDAYVTGGEK